LTVKKRRASGRGMDMGWLIKGLREVAREVLKAWKVENGRRRSDSGMCVAGL